MSGSADADASGENCGLTSGDEPLRFEVVAEDAGSGARAGLLHTPHGTIETPVFMPVGTRAAVKTLSQQDLSELGAGIILGNAYHLYLRPGTDVIAGHGGLHEFMSWPGAILTDSGGYQVFSLADLTEIEEDGVRFQSHLDGSHHLFSPERVMEIEHQLGADVIMAFDECTPYPCDADYARQSMDRTLRWAARCRDSHERRVQDQGRRRQALFGIVQGSVFPDLRSRCCEELAAMEFDGYALGGLGVGEPREKMLEMTNHCLPHLPADCPRYLMGVGLPHDLVESVAIGVDMFDCVIPTRNARNGTLFTPEGRLRIKNARYAGDGDPLVEGCRCRACRFYHRSYIRHLFQTNEFLGYHLATYHNVHFFLDLMRRMRGAIVAGSFGAWKKEFLGGYRDP